MSHSSFLRTPLLGESEANKKPENKASEKKMITLSNQLFTESTALTKKIEDMRRYSISLSAKVSLPHTGIFKEGKEVIKDNAQDVEKTLNDPKGFAGLFAEYKRLNDTLIRSDYTFSSEAEAGNTKLQGALNELFDKLTYLPKVLQTKYQPNPDMPGIRAEYPVDPAVITHLSKLATKFKDIYLQNHEAKTERKLQSS